MSESRHSDSELYYPGELLFWISQKPNLIIVLLYIEWNKKKLVCASSLRARKQRDRTWHDYPEKSCTSVIHDMITRDLDMVFE